MNYDSFAQTFSSSRKNLSWPELDYIIDDMKKQGYSTILDVGCGNGRFIEEAKKRGFSPREYLGTDNSQGMLDEAQKLHLDKDFTLMGMENLTYLDQKNISFDAIIFLASFHHLDTEQKRIDTLTDIQNLLASHGRIYLTNWNLHDQKQYDPSRKTAGEYEIKIGTYSRYYHGFTLSELTSLFKEAGFKIEEHRVFEGGKNILSILSV